VQAAGIDDDGGVQSSDDSRNAGRGLPFPLLGWRRRIGVRFDTSGWGVARAIVAYIAKESILECRHATAKVGVVVLKTSVFNFKVQFGIGIDDAREGGQELVKGRQRDRYWSRMTTTHNALAEVVWPFLMSEMFLVLLPLMKYSVRLFLFLSSVLATDPSLHAPQNRKAKVPLMYCCYPQQWQLSSLGWQPVTIVLRLDAATWP
jgi:hypothetical protein